jgi:hypothetical protein
MPYKMYLEILLIHCERGKKLMRSEIRYMNQTMASEGLIPEYGLGRTNTRVS